MKILNPLLKQLYDTFNVFSTYGTLTIDSLDEENEYVVHINKFQKELFCIELSGASNLPNYLGNQIFDELFKDFREENNAHMLQVLLKKERHQKHYIFSNNQKMLSIIAKNLAVKFVDAFEIIEIFNDLGLNQNWVYKNKKEEREHRVLNSNKLKYETLTSSINSIVKDNFYKNIGNNNIKVFQSYSFKDSNRKIDYNQVFKEDWEGLIYIYTDFSKNTVLATLEKLKNQASLEGLNKNNFIDLIEQYKDGTIELCIRNLSIVVKNPKANSISKLAYEFSCDVREKELFLRRLLKYTPLVKRDTYGDRVVEKETTLYNSIASVHKKETKNADFSGKGVNGGFFDFNFAQTTVDLKNKNSSSIVIGVTGSGKTTTTNGMKARMLGCDLDKLFEKDAHLKYNFKDVVTQLDESYIREFDIKYSGYQLLQYFVPFGHDDVKLINAEINTYRYNPFNINIILEEGRRNLDFSELSMNILLLSIALECKDPNLSISLSEERILKEVIEMLYKKGFSTGYIAELEKSNPLVYAKLIRKGYKRDQKISDVNEPTMPFLKAPILHNVLTQVKIYSGTTVDEVDSKNAQSLYRKLKDIDSLKIFSTYDNDSIDLAKYLYIDFDKIKKTDEFIPVFLSVFNKMFTEDKKKQRELASKGIQRPYITYIFEEAFNLFSKPSFKQYLQIFMNEARSDRLRALFVVQLIEQVPEYIYKQIENKFLLFPSANKRIALIDEISEVLKPNEDTKKFMHETPEFGVFLWNEHTSSAFVLDSTMKEIEAFGQGTD